MIKRIVNLKYKNGQSVTKYLSNFHKFLNELSTIKLVLDDKVQALLLLSFFMAVCETYVVSLNVIMLF